MYEIPQPFRDPELDLSGEIVGFYPREFFAFDNFSAFQVIWNGRRYATSEHAYHASKFLETDSELAEEISNAMSPHDALKLAHANADKVSENWDEIKIGRMEDICRHKLMQNPYIQKKLLQTGDVLIVEDSPKDDFWGWGPNRDGRNELGKIWMRLRQTLFEETVDMLALNSFLL